MKKYKIIYIEELGGELKNAYVEGEIETKNKTNEILERGYFIKEVYNWNKYQNRYCNYGDERTKVLELYNTRQNLKNYIQIMNK